MSDQQAWSFGIIRISALLDGLSEEARFRLTGLLGHYRQVKETVAAIVSEYDSAAVCRDCGGQCCLNGKYRMSVFDVMAFSAAAQPPQLPNYSQKPLCPYGTEHGCAMAPAIRPADCVLFICDLLDRNLSPQARFLLAEHEQIMRECICSASLLTGEPLGKPMLLWAGNSRK